MKKQTTKTFLAVLLGAGMSQGILQAQNPFHEPGDLVLFLQKPGTTNSIYVSLGSAANLYRGSAAGPTADRQALNIININTQLTAAFGSGWASDTNVYAGLIAARSSSPGIQVFDGDQTRTLYASRSRSGVGTPGSPASAPWDFTGSGAETAGAQQAIGFTNIFETNYTTKAAVALVSVSKVDTYNPFLDVPLGIQDLAFKAFTGGIQQRGEASTYGAFGPVASPEFMLDLYRIVPLEDGDTVGEVSGVRRVGSYEGTVTIDSGGRVSFITQGSAVAPFEDWVASFPELVNSPNAADRSPNGDFDKDGVPNIREFAFGGSPVSGSDNGKEQIRTVDANSDNLHDLTITIEVRSGATFTPSGNKLTATKDGIVYTIEGTSNLQSFGSKVSEVIPSLGSGSPKPGYVFKTFRLDSSSGLNGKGFIRAGAAVAP